MPLAHERRPEETSKAFAAFVCYLSFGPQRSVELAAEKVGKAVGTLRKWSERHGWVARAREYDEFCVEQEREIQAVVLRHKAVDWAHRQEALKELEWGVAEKLIQKALRLIEDPSVKWTGGDIAKALDIASKLGRLATGMETDRKELTGKDGGPVKVEIDVAPLIRRVYGDQGGRSHTAFGGGEGVIDVPGGPAALEDRKEGMVKEAGAPAELLTESGSGS